jgi:hypothetical protein
MRQLASIKAALLFSSTALPAFAFYPTASTRQHSLLRTPLDHSNNLITTLLSKRQCREHTR